MHQSKQAFKFGLKVIAHMKLLWTSSASAMGCVSFWSRHPRIDSLPVAKLDLKYHSPKIRTRRERDISKEKSIIRNSTYLNNAAVLNPIDE